MAVDIINGDEDAKKKAASNAAIAPPPGAGAAVSQPTGATGGTQGQGQQTAQSPSNPKGSGFTNLQKIISANKNNQLGNVIQSGVSGQAGQAREALTQAKSQFGQETAANEIGGQQDINNRSNIINKIVPINTVGAGPNAQPATTEVQTAQNVPQTSNLSGLPISQSDIDTFAKYRSGNYGGPQDLTNYDTLSGQANQIQGLGKNTTSAAGLQNLLKQYAGRGAYTTGQQGLDAAILGQTGGNQLSAARKATLGLTSNVDAAERAAQETAKAKLGQAKSFADQTKAQLGGLDVGETPDKDESTGLIGDIQKDLRNRANTFKDTEGGKYQDFLRGIGGGTGDVNAGEQGEFTPEVLKALGLQQGESLYDVDLAKALQGAGSFNPNTINEQTVAGQGDVAKYNALRQLAGQDAGYLTNAGGAQGFQVDPTKVQELRDTLNSKKGQFENLSKQITDLTADPTRWISDTRQFLQDSGYSDPTKDGGSFNPLNPTGSLPINPVMSPAGGLASIPGLPKFNPIGGAASGADLLTGGGARTASPIVSLPAGFDSQNAGNGSYFGVTRAPGESIQDWATRIHGGAYKQLQDQLNAMQGKNVRTREIIKK